jgi:hypothetical protein
VYTQLSSADTPPKLILVNQEIIPEAETITLHHPKFILPVKDLILTYLAYCVEGSDETIPSFQPLLIANTLCKPTTTLRKSKKM